MCSLLPLMMILHRCRFCAIVATVISLVWPVCCESCTYKTVDLETNADLCAGHGSSGNKISILPNESAIIRLGHMLIYDSSEVKKCKLLVEAPPGFGVSMTINSMNLDFSRNEFTGSMTCHDYVQFRRPPRNIFLNALVSLASAFADKSEKICRRKYKMNTHRPELYYTGKAANIFYTLRSRVVFRYKRGDQRGNGQEFSIVATAFKATNGSCPTSYIRCGIQTTSYCISERLRCDNFINCGFPSSGVDEEGCGDNGWRLDDNMSTHTFIWVTLVLTLAVFICCLISCAMRCWSGPAHSTANGRLRLWFASSGSRPPAGSAATSSSGPAAERQHLSPLPSYDSVVRDQGSHESGRQSPPAYKDLFPQPTTPPTDAEAVPLHAVKRTEVAQV